MIIRAICIFLFYLFSDSVRAQEGLLEESISSKHLEWFNGSISKNDGTVLRGLVKYNNKNGVLYYGNEEESTTLTSRSVSAFNFYDEANDVQRQFISLEYDDPKTGAKSPQFFEIIREFEKFAFLAKSDPVEIEHFVNNRNSINNTGGDIFNHKIKVEVEQTETLYVLEQNGNIRPYCKVVINEMSDINRGNVGNSSSEIKTRMINRDALELQIEKKHWQELRSYAKREGLSFKIKADLLKILDYYTDLLKQ